MPFQSQDGNCAPQPACHALQYLVLVRPGKLQPELGRKGTCPHYAMATWNRNELIHNVPNQGRVASRAAGSVAGRPNGVSGPGGLGGKFPGPLYTKAVVSRRSR